MTFQEWVDLAGRIVDAAGVVTVVIGLVVATVTAAWRVLRGRRPVYRLYRRSLGRSILLGLELLVAADIIRTVGLDPTLLGVVTLGGIVLIRTFLSFSLEVEITGRWPWQKLPADPDAED